MVIRHVSIPKSARLTDRDIVVMRNLRKYGFTLDSVSRVTGFSTATVWRITADVYIPGGWRKDRVVTSTGRVRLMK